MGEVKLYLKAVLFECIQNKKGLGAITESTMQGEANSQGADV